MAPTPLSRQARCLSYWPPAEHVSARSLIELTFNVAMSDAELLAAAPAADDAGVSTVPLISTFLFKCFSRSSLPALRFRPFCQLGFKVDPLVPVVLLAELPPAATFLRTNCDALAPVVPAVPAADELLPAFSTQPVRVTDLPIPLDRSIDEVGAWVGVGVWLGGGVCGVCAPTPTAIAAASTVPNKN